MMMHTGWLPDLAAAQSCDYDTAAWGVEFNGAAGGPNDAASQWPVYFTADFICSKGTSCTCASRPQVCGLHPCSSSLSRNALHACHLP